MHCHPPRKHERNPSASWAFDSEPMRVRRIIVKNSDRKNVLRSFLRIPSLTCELRYIIMQAVMVRERRSVDCLGKHDFIFRHFTVKNLSLPYLLRGSLDYMFSGLLKRMQHLKTVCG